MMYYLLKWNTKNKKKIKYDTNIINLMQKYFDNDNKKVIEPSIFKDS